MLQKTGKSQLSQFKTELKDITFQLERDIFNLWSIAEKPQSMASRREEEKTSRELKRASHV